MENTSIVHNHSFFHCLTLVIMRMQGTCQIVFILSTCEFRPKPRQAWEFQAYVWIHAFFIAQILCLNSGSFVFQILCMNSGFFVAQIYAVYQFSGHCEAFLPIFCTFFRFFTCFRLFHNHWLSCLNLGKFA